jgi:hypothetical protein
MAHTTEDRPATRSSDPVLLALQVTAALTVLNLLWQFVSAGELIGRFGNEAWEEPHGVGAIVLHVVSGLAMLAAAALWRLRGAPLWPAVLAAVVFVLSFVQAYFGAGRTLWIHVPGAMILTIGAVWLAVWAFRPRLAR